DLFRTRAVNGDCQNLRRAFNDEPQLVSRVKIQSQQQAKARAQRPGKQSGARGGAHKSERLHFDGVGARRGPLPDNDIELIILQRGIQDFFQRWLQPVDLVEEQHLPALNVGEDGGEVALDRERRAGCLLKLYPQLVGDDAGQRGLAQSRRAIEQHVVQRLAARARRFNGHAEIFFDLRLPDEFLQQARPQLQFKRSIVFHRHGGDDPLFYLWSWFGAHAG